MCVQTVHMKQIRKMMVAMMSPQNQQQAPQNYNRQQTQQQNMGTAQQGAVAAMPTNVEDAPKHQAPQGI